MSQSAAGIVEEFDPTTPAELSRLAAENARGAREALIPVGGRTALAYGYEPVRAARIVSLSRMARVIDYPARDMTVTVEAGLRVEELAAMLATERQQLPIDVPQANRATVGGIVATNTSGPRRFGYGTLRDYVIGISAVDAQGRLFKAGGRVVKNVAGYDLCKLLVGSLGTLAIITEVTFKLKPIPEQTAIVWATCDSYDLLDRTMDLLLTSAACPVMVEVLNQPAARQICTESRTNLPIDGPVLCLGVEGGEREIAWQIEQLTRELARYYPLQLESIRGEPALSIRQALVDFPVNSDDPVTFKANLRPSGTLAFFEAAAEAGVTLQAHAANGIVIGHLPDRVTTCEAAQTLLEPLCRIAREFQGNLTILQCAADWKSRLPVFGEPEASRPLMRKLKAQLDPHGILNPGRFIDGGDS